MKKSFLIQKIVLDLVIQKKKKMDRNDKYGTRGNEALDKVLCITANLSVLSDKFCNKIDNIALWTLSNSKGKETEIEEAIQELKKAMFSLTIFSHQFIYEIESLLIKGLEFEKSRYDGK